MKCLRYLIARPPPRYPGDYNQAYITFLVDSDSRLQSADRENIGIYTGSTAHDAGGEMSPANVLERPGLQEIIQKCGGAWFIPMIQRMADGETINLEEIITVYRNINGNEIESAPIGKRFPCEEAAIAWREARNEISIVEQQPREIADRLLFDWLQEHPENETFKHSDIVSYVFRDQENNDFLSYRYFRKKVSS